MSVPMKNIIKPIPIIVCGKSAYVAVGVKEGIRPAYEGLPPPSKEWANLGTQKYGEKVAAVVAGGGYNDTDFEQL
ncbi:unnamed protein product [Penicillium glandicola]